MNGYFYVNIYISHHLIIKRNYKLLALKLIMPAHPDISLIKKNLIVIQKFITKIKIKE